MPEDNYQVAIVNFLREEFPDATDDGQITDTTPLMESGVLDSLRIAVLMTFIRDRLGLLVPLEKIDARNFADVRSIAAMLRDAEPVPAPSGGRR
ncbi:phosphopantetheine-binding protein [Micromonospora sp. NBC_01405]|uniref:acyl carrier protein n=1 Tax=Micromonospora sp. NBC_01405 TaxID=2903589 RepID=UPI00324B1DAB